MFSSSKNPRLAMHVCHFCETSVEGEYFRHIAEGLICRGVRISFLELGKHRPPSWLASVPGASYYSLNISRPVAYPFGVLRLANYLRNERIDILHTHLFNSGLIAGLTKALYRRPIYAYMRHHTDIVRMLGGATYSWLDKWMSERADRLLTVSEAAKRYMQDVDRIRTPIDVVHLGFDFNRFACNETSRREIRNEFGIAEDNFVIGYIGNFAPRKGHLQLITAYAEVLKLVPNARLLLVGRGRLQEVSDLIGRLGLGRRIIFAGWRKDVSKCLNAMDVFVQPSLSEAFSQVLVEAMGVGLPVIATDVGGAKEVITNHFNGILISSDDVDAITHSLHKIWADSDFATTIANNGSQSVRDRFGVEIMVQRQFKLYESWLEEYVRL